MLGNPLFPLDESCSVACNRGPTKRRTSRRPGSAMSASLTASVARQGSDHRRRNYTAWRSIDMGPGSLLRETWEMIPILLLLVAGSLIALRSGVDRPASNRGFPTVCWEPLSDVVSGHRAMWRCCGGSSTGSACALRWAGELRSSRLTVLPWRLPNLPFEDVVDEPDREGKHGILDGQQVGRQSGRDSQGWDHPFLESRPAAGHEPIQQGGRLIPEVSEHG